MPANSQILIIDNAPVSQVSQKATRIAANSNQIAKRANRGREIYIEDTK